MTKKKVKAALMAFAVVLAGCASAPTNPGGVGNNADPAAAKLAADINAIGPEGGTVTLSDWVGLNTALTVPPGVTLDLTAEGAALELQDGAVLTVNGTVRTTGHGDHDKGHVEGSIRVGDGAAVINGSGTINLTSKGRLLNIGGNKKLTLDGVTLVGLPDNDSPLVGIYENSALILKSGAITGNTRSSDEWAGGGGVEVYKGTFTMEGGVISGNSAQGKDGSSGGVHIGEEAVFTMSGGTISGNSTTASGTSAFGGGVNVWRGTFTMEAGTISGNSVNGKAGSGGGGVAVEKGMFTMSGGTIFGNTVGNTGESGGGVRVLSNGAFIMRGGKISGNTVQGSGGGVQMTNEGGFFTMEGGEISNNTAEMGGGVRVVVSGTFTMSGGTISGNTASNGGGGVSIDDDGSFTMDVGTIYGKADSLPAGTDASLANSARNGVSLLLNRAATAKWGTGGAYTKGGTSPSGGSDIGTTDDTLIAVPAK